jgi:hypothetical protein
MAAANHAPADRKSITEIKFKMISNFILQFPGKLETLPQFDHSKSYQV